MDFPAVLRKYGEHMTKAALVKAVAHMRGVIRARTESAIDGVLLLTMDELYRDAQSVARTLDEFPFSADEKSAIINKAWEIIGP
jgi:hypothetical protein